METIPKSTQEVAAQSLNTLAFFSETAVPDAQQLNDQFLSMRQDLRDFRPYVHTDKDLTDKLEGLRAGAVTAGIWEPAVGQGSDERVAYGVERMLGYGYPEEQAVQEAFKGLKQNGYLNGLRQERRYLEREFTEPTQKYLEEKGFDGEAEKVETARLLESTVDITTLNDDERAKLATDFPSGNFIFHGAQTEQIIKILEDGGIVTAKTLQTREESAAAKENRREELVHRNSGYEGISWSLNGIDALPGTRYHLAGFVAAPENILGDTEQFAVPSRPSPNEVIQISGDIDANVFYDSKTQLEMYTRTGVFGETNSVLSSLMSVAMWEDESKRENRREPLLYQAQRDLPAEPDYREKLRALYDIEEHGHIRLQPDLVQQTENEISVAAVWLQAAIDTNRFKDITAFAGKELPELIAAITDENSKALIAEARKDWEPLDEKLNAAVGVVGEVQAPIEKLYFVAARKDAATWLKILATLPRKPAGVLLYDDKKVRLENFASEFVGSHKELTDELRNAIVPAEGYIDYTDVLGVEFDDSMRAGQSHQVIAESKLDKRRIIKKQGEKLLIV